MRSIADVDEHQAELALRTYSSDESSYAWPAYDTDYRPEVLAPIDVLAPAFLDYPIRGSYLRQMFKGGNESTPHTELFAAMSAVVSDETAAELDFWSISKGDLQNRETPGWGLVLRAIDVAQTCAGLTSVAVTKILHRKRPSLVPIHDARLRTFYGIFEHSYEQLFLAIHDDVVANLDLLTDWSRPYALADGRTMSRLRALDIVIWMQDEPGWRQPDRAS